MDLGRAAELVGAAGGKERVVIDLSCRKVVVEKDEEKEEEEERKVRWMVAMDRWQVITDVEVCKGLERTHFPHYSIYSIYSCHFFFLC